MNLANGGNAPGVTGTIYARLDPDQLDPNTMRPLRGGFWLVAAHPFGRASEQSYRLFNLGDGYRPERLDKASMEKTHFNDNPGHVFEPRQWEEDLVYSSDRRWSWVAGSIDKGLTGVISAHCYRSVQTTVLLRTRSGSLAEIGNDWRPPARGITTEVLGYGTY